MGEPVERDPLLADPVSIICTVKNDSRGLELMLRSVVGQLRPNDELVIVDGGSGDAELAAIGRIVQVAATSALDRGSTVRLLEFPGVNIARGRNLAIESARQELILCIDAGCRARLDWREALARPFLDPVVEVAAGRTILCAESHIAQLAGILTMPGRLRRANPGTLNPSARCLALRKSLWRRAGGFPEWLYTAEDTLFNLKLRGLDPAPTMAWVGKAAVEWSPRTTWRGLWRQHAQYARGETRIGRGGEAKRYGLTRMAAMAAWLAVAGVAAASIGTWVALAALFVILAMLCSGNAVSAIQAAMAAQIGERDALSTRGPLPLISYRRMLFDFILGALVKEWIGWATLFGACTPHGLRLPSKLKRFLLDSETSECAEEIARERAAARLGAGALDAERLEEYLSSTALSSILKQRGSLTGAAIPPWRLAQAPTPCTAIIAWHWAPTNRASANVMSHIFADADPDRFLVLTRGKEPGEKDERGAKDAKNETGGKGRPRGPENNAAMAPSIPVIRVHWPLDDDRPIRLKTWAANVKTAATLLAAGLALRPHRDLSGVLAVFPTNYSALAGGLFAHALGLPLTLYFHDQMTETLLTKSASRRALWRFVEHGLLQRAALVLTPTEEFAKRLWAKGAAVVHVLPHCAPRDARALEQASARRVVGAGPTRAGILYTASSPSAAFRLPARPAAGAQFNGVPSPSYAVSALSCAAAGVGTVAATPVIPPPRPLKASIPRDASGPDMEFRNGADRSPPDKLRLIYAGAVYEAHFDAMRALYEAVDGSPGVTLRVYSNNPEVPPLFRHEAVPRAVLFKALLRADVCVAALGWDTPYPEEVAGCFPSKIVEYVALGKPLLCVVPAGCFVDRLVKKEGIGVCVNAPVRERFRAAFAYLADPANRRACRRAALGLADRLDAARWFPQLLSWLGEAETGGQPRPLAALEGRAPQPHLFPLTENAAREFRVAEALASPNSPHTAAATL